MFAQGPKQDEFNAGSEQICVELLSVFYPFTYIWRI